MCRKIIAGLLALTLILLCFGCGKGGVTKLKADQKVAVLVESVNNASETYQAVRQLSASYGDSVQILPYPQGYFSNKELLAELAVSAVQDPAVKAIVVVDAVPGTAEAVRQAREARSDLAIVVCNPYEDTAAFTENADLVLGLDVAAYTDAVIAQTKSFGAENFVFFSTRRDMENALIKNLYDAMGKACEKEKLKFDGNACIDRIGEGKSLDDAKLFIAEAGTRKVNKFGKKTAMFCTDPLMQGALAKAAADHEMYMAAAFLPSPLALAADLGVDLAGHETDSAYAMEQLKAAASESGIAGRTATWSYSEPVVLVQAAFAYAAGFAAGDTGTVCTLEDAGALVKQYAGDAKAELTADANGAYLLASDLVTL